MIIYFDSKRDKSLFLDSHFLIKGITMNMNYIVSPNIYFSNLNNNIEYIYTFNSNAEIVPIFLNSKYINAMKNLESKVDSEIFENLLNAGYISNKYDDNIKIINSK